MRRIVASLVVLAATTALLLSGTAAGGEEGTYEVRAIFDNASFLVPGEEVRVAGAKVGSVSEVDVTGFDETARKDGEPEPGKAAVVLRIDDPGFQDFRTDASCLIRPQSLIGEKFVECEPTQPRAPGSEPPPELALIPEGEQGEGQRLLPLEQNGKAVDLDLVNNIMKEPYPDRFRLILNDLGAGLAARGEELAEIVERSNPALRETNRVLAILARQNRDLASLATDSDAILGALARERESVVSFINQAATVGEATAERGADLEETFARFPEFLRELRTTMVELRSFSDEARPTFADLRIAAPALTRANRLLEPFSNAGVGALTTLGDAAEEAGPLLRDSDPVIRQVRDLARDGEQPTRDLAKILSTLRKTRGFEYLLKTVFGVGGAINAFDSNGHFLRALIPTNSCFDYTSILQPGCGANFTGPAGIVGATVQREQARAEQSALRELGDDRGGRDSAKPSAEAEPSAEPEPTPPGLPGPSHEDVGETEFAPRPDAASSRHEMRAARELLDFMIGARSREGRRR